MVLSRLWTTFRKLFWMASIEPPDNLPDDPAPEELTARFLVETLDTGNDEEVGICQPNLFRFAASTTLPRWHPTTFEYCEEDISIRVPNIYRAYETIYDCYRAVSRYGFVCGLCAGFSRGSLSDMNVP
jgi:hypothetical protein